MEMRTAVTHQSGTCIDKSFLAVALFELANERTSFGNEVIFINEIY